MDAMQRLVQDDAVRRLWERDTTLFTDDPACAGVVANRLGWLGLASAEDPIGDDIRRLAADAVAEGVRDIVLLGMGGSSLAPLVVSRILATGPEHPHLHVLDTTSPATVRATLDEIAAESTWVIVASKSGTTIEPLALYAVFRQWMERRLVAEGAGRAFVAITDTGTPLESLAREQGFRAVLSAPADVGGRFSALTPFGLAPAMLIGVDVETLLDSARSMEEACREPAEQNPAAALAAFAVGEQSGGRDKLTLVTSAELKAFGLWVEQLIAESTGKHGTGVVPVLEPKPAIPTGFNADRAVVVLRYEDDDLLASWAGLASEEGSPVHEIVVSRPTDLGGEFVRWEVATALMGFLLGIDPFDQPNVAEAKAATGGILDGSSKPPAPAFVVDGAEVTFGGPLTPPVEPPALAEALEPLIDSLRPGDYLAILAYLPERAELFDPLAAAAKATGMATARAVCLELGPRYLHSTGQLHKGGPDEGAFLIVTAPAADEVAIPGKPFDLGTLWRAQAEGDLATLAAHGRRVVRIDLPDANPRTVSALADTLTAVARSGVRA
jgi:glucose-6-phosphate isomerase